MPSFILASQSPRRKTLLEWAEIPFEIIVSDTDESYPASIAIETVPEFIAKNKALAVKEMIHSTKPELVNWCIIAADTVVVLDQKIIGKPSNKQEAIDSLQALSGQTHKVITGVVLLYQEKEISFSETTLVEFHALTPEQIEFYVDKYQPYDKACLLYTSPSPRD